LVEAFEYDGTKLIALRRSELASFSVSQATGDFRGQGPGMLSSWSLGDNVKFSPTDRPQANQPQTTSDQRWQYVNVTFEGQVTGNLQRNEAILSDRVKVITAPVEKASVKFQQNQI